MSFFSLLISGLLSISMGHDIPIQHVLFKVDFEKYNKAPAPQKRLDWGGFIDSVNTPAESERSLKAFNAFYADTSRIFDGTTGEPGYHPKDWHFPKATSSRQYGHCLRVGMRIEKPRTRDSTMLHFSFYCRKITTLKIILFDAVKDFNYAYTLKNMAQNKWVDTIINVSRDFMPNGENLKKLKPGHVLTDFFAGGGKAGDTKGGFWIDNIILYNEPF